MAATKKPPHKAKPTKKNRKHERNYLFRSKRDSKGITRYVARMKARGTFKVRKSRARGGGSGSTGYVSRKKNK